MKEKDPDALSKSTLSQSIERAFENTGKGSFTHLYTNKLKSEYFLKIYLSLTCACYDQEPP